MKGKILIVEDDPLIADMVKRYLEREGFRVEWREDGASAISYLNSDTPDVVILDLMLPDIDGFELCKKLSESNSMVIVLSAKDEDEDRIVGLELGADDYMTKPFNMRELIARVKALLRRRRKFMFGEGYLRAGALEVRSDEMKVYVNSEPLDLTPKEFLILKKLISKRGKVVSRQELVNEIYDREPPDYERIIDTYIYRIRTKVMELDSASAERIKTIRGFGYKFE